MANIDLHIAIVSDEGQTLSCVEGRDLDWPAEVQELVGQLATHGPTDVWHDAAYEDETQTWHLALSPSSIVLQHRLVVGIGHRSPRPGLRVNSRPKRGDLTVDCGAPITRRECHDLKTLLTAALLGIEVVRSGKAAKGLEVAEQALGEALQLLSPVEDPSIPTDLARGHD